MGCWKNGFRHGKGTEADKGKNAYIGEWKYGSISKGKQIFSNGEIHEGTFEGGFEDAVLDIGVMDNLDEDGDYFLIRKAEIHKRKSVKRRLVSTGKLYYRDGTIYEGEFVGVNPGPHGKGTLTHSDGKVEKGIWENGDLIK